MGSNRRTFFKTLGAGAAGLTLKTAATSAAAGQTEKRTAKADPDGPILRVGDDIAVADTAYGKVRGYVLRGIHYFLGVPYGADTSGANRFMPPQKPKPWTDVRPALWWGNTAPQNMDNRYANKYDSFRDHWNYDDVSEDCLRLNVFTPALEGRQEAAGDVLDPRRRLHQRQRHRARRLQRREPRALRRRRLRVRSTTASARSATATWPASAARSYAASGQRRHARHRRRPRVGARQHRELRRRPRQRDDHGPVGRRREGVRADARCRRPRACSTRPSC